MSKKKNTVSVIVRPTKELMARLNELAEMYPRESANAILVEIARDYSELWAEAQERLKSTREEIINEQWERMRQWLNNPLVPAAAEGELKPKPQAQGKKGRK